MIWLGVEGSQKASQYILTRGTVHRLLHSPWLSIFRCPRRMLSKSHQSQNIATAKYDMLHSYKKTISETLQPILNIDKEILYSAIQKPNRLDEGDLVLPLPKLDLPREKLVGIEKPETILEGNDNLFHEIIIKKNFIQFFFNHDVLLDKTIGPILTCGANYGKSNTTVPKNVLIEFSSPNIAKPFHAGHLRSTIIGEFLSNLYETFGWNVIRMNYLGDWGKQFGILAVGYENFGNSVELEKDPITHLFNVYVLTNAIIEDEIRKSPINESQLRKKAQTFFKRMEDGDLQALDLWRQFRRLSIEKYIQTYSRLGIQFDTYSGESEVTKQSIGQILHKLSEMSLVHNNNGAKEIDLTRFDRKLGKIIVAKSDNTSLYVTRDIYACIDRYEKYKFDKMIYVVACQQDLYMKQLFAIVKQLNAPLGGKLEHVNFGMVNGMSTRKGNVVFLDKIIDETTKQMMKVMQSKDNLEVEPSKIHQVAEQLGLSAILIQDMKSKRINNYNFDWKRMLSFEGNTGPYLQYTHSRLCAIENKLRGVINVQECIHADLSPLKRDDAITLIRILSQYHYTLQKTFESREASTLVNYLFVLARQISTCYKTMWVLGQPREIAMAHLGLYLASKQVLANGLRILGIKPIHRM